MGNGPKPLTTRTYNFDVGNATNIEMFSKNDPSITQTNHNPLKYTRTKNSSCMSLVDAGNQPKKRFHLPQRVPPPETPLKPFNTPWKT